MTLESYLYGLEGDRHEGDEGSYGCHSWIVGVCYRERGGKEGVDMDLDGLSPLIVYDPFDLTNVSHSTMVRKPRNTYSLYSKPSASVPLIFK